MRVNVISGILLIPTCIAFGQVGISKNSDQKPTLPPYTSLYLDGNQKEGSSLGVILPHVTKGENLPKTTCVLVACEKVDIPFFMFSEEGVDELRILDHATQKIRIRNSDLYRIQLSIAFRSSGVHVTPPQISIQALKNEEIVGQAIANMNTLLISGNAPMTASATFNIWAEPNDILSFTAGGSIPILTIADTYTAQPNPATFVIIERILLKTINHINGPY